MRAMLFTGVGAPLHEADAPDPAPGPGQVRLEIHACGVCRTDLHIVEGELAEPKLPLVLGHQIVGTVVELGEGAARLELGQRVGVPWLGWTCGDLPLLQFRPREPLRPRALHRLHDRRRLRRADGRRRALLLPDSRGVSAICRRRRSSAPG